MTINELEHNKIYKIVCTSKPTLLNKGLSLDGNDMILYYVENNKYYGYVKIDRRKEFIQDSTGFHNAILESEFECV